MSTVLVIDNEYFFHELIEVRLKRLFANLRFLYARDGEQGLSLFTKHKEEIVLVILDLDMPILDGWGFLEKYIEKFSQATFFSEMKIIIFSSGVSTEPFQTYAKQIPLYLSDKTLGELEKVISGIF